MPEPDYQMTGLPSGDPSVYSPRLCDYTGLYFCSVCHWDDRAVVPGRVIHNWDFDKYSVSCGTRQYLELMCGKPVLDVEKANPFLFNFVDELRHVKKLREEMMLMKQYFLSCRAALESRILLAFGGRQYFVESSHLYSMRDLMEVRSGQLLAFLLAVHAKFAKHIREEAMPRVEGMMACA
ncbi:differentially expressed in FDCP 8 homolog [Pollicipes pollicipes]|uniref:differentially expressed in FDCP 8 homolog n=1 Tax=Pollicipes pollicipes TaxID=41117 RepID=UPI001885134F|nr:differentially expressed in FDCP 8 homolog [Pollicipes pollicipes]